MPNQTMQKTTTKLKFGIDSRTHAVLSRKGYSIRSVIKTGNFGVIFKGTSKDSNLTVVIKMIDLISIDPKFNNKFLPREIAALINIRHPNVIWVYDITKRWSKDRIYVFMDFANGLDLFTHLKKNGSCNEELACFWLTQIASALEYMHDQMQFAHRDVKCENVLLHDNCAKLTDFGLAKHIIDRKVMSKTICGTEAYQSPQLISKVDYDAFAADSWATGCLMFVMLNGSFPFHYENTYEMYREQSDLKIVINRLEKVFSKDLVELQLKFFTFDEKRRITMAQVLKFPWIVRKGKGRPM